MQWKNIVEFWYVLFIHALSCTLGMSRWTDTSDKGEKQGD